MNRKGFVQDFYYMLAFLFMFAIFCFALYIAWSEINTSFQSASIDNEGVFLSMFTAYQNYIDPLFLSIVFAFWIGSLFLAYFIKSSPLLFWVYWIIVMVGGVTGAYLANAWISLMSEEPFSLIVQHFSITDFFMSNYLIFLLVYGFSLLIVFFAKPSGGELQIETL